MVGGVGVGIRVLDLVVIVESERAVLGFEVVRNQWAADYTAD